MKSTFSAMEETTDDLLIEQEEQQKPVSVFILGYAFIFLAMINVLGFGRVLYIKMEQTHSVLPTISYGYIGLLVLATVISFLLMRFKPAIRLIFLLFIIVVASASVFAFTQDLLFNYDTIKDSLFDKAFQEQIGRAHV